MHETSMRKMIAFREVYAKELASADGPCRVLDIGSMAFDEGSTYRSVFSRPRFDYRGLDVAPGPNVDVVPGDPYLWEELDRESVDVVIAGQSLEHNPFFWITAAEIGRVLVPGGLVALIAPSTGPVHRFPFDCWRFYPDAWIALCAYVQMEPLEHYVEAALIQKSTEGTEWRDSLLIARKPLLTDGTVRDAYYERLAAITSTRCSLPDTQEEADRIGPAIAMYESAERRVTSVAMLSKFLRAAKQGSAEAIRSARGLWRRASTRELRRRS